MDELIPYLGERSSHSLSFIINEREFNRYSVVKYNNDKLLSKLNSFNLFLKSILSINDRTEIQTFVHRYDFKI